MNRSSDAALELAENESDNNSTLSAFYFLAYALVMVIKEFLEEYKAHNHFTENK
jgi:hypothetical protein